MSVSNVIMPEDLPVNITDYAIKAKLGNHSKDALPQTIGEIEKVKILDALQKTGWIQSKACRLLGITPRQIAYKMRKYNIQPPALSP